jgi:hypothetical protein
MSYNLNHFIAIKLFIFLKKYESPEQICAI